VAPEARLSAFVQAVRARVRQRVTDDEAVAYRESMSLDDCWSGLERYWSRVRNRGGADAR
jgi:hypothetical protein